MSAEGKNTEIESPQHSQTAQWLGSTSTNRKVRVTIEFTKAEKWGIAESLIKTLQ